MQALKQAELATILIDQFKNSFFNLIVDTVLAQVKPMISAMRFRELHSHSV
jgi:hypothetical protein